MRSVSCPTVRFSPALVLLACFAGAYGSDFAGTPAKTSGGKAERARRVTNLDFYKKKLLAMREDILKRVQRHEAAGLATTHRRRSPWPRAPRGRCSHGRGRRLDTAWSCLTVSAQSA